MGTTTAQLLSNPHTEHGSGRLNGNGVYVLLLRHRELKYFFLKATQAISTPLGRLDLCGLGHDTSTHLL